VARLGTLEDGPDNAKAVTQVNTAAIPGIVCSSERGLFLMHRIPVSSVDITQVGYQEDSETLEIQFSHGEVCQFFNVPSVVYDELMQSPAKEEYYHLKIGERFPCSRIR
jgi:hypothetical protein